VFEHQRAPKHRVPVKETRCLRRILQHRLSVPHIPHAEDADVRWKPDTALPGLSRSGSNRIFPWPVTRFLDVLFYGNVASTAYVERPDLEDRVSVHAQERRPRWWRMNESGR